MRYGVVLPSGDARTAANLASAAETAGWDGFFVWEPVWGIDAWVSLTAAAMVTERIRLGTLLTPLSRMRPWELASKTATLDQLSGGRVILAVGLGALDTGFAAFGEVTDRVTRAELLDEGLAILTGLWRGQPFSFTGKHYRIAPTTFAPPPPPIQQPRIPVWVVGLWPSQRSMRRVARYDGLLPMVRNSDGSPGELQPDDLRAMAAWVAEHRTLTTPFDIVVEGETSGADPEAAAATVRPWAEAGATWWIEAWWGTPGGADRLPALFERVRHGPPRLDG